MTSTPVISTPSVSRIESGVSLHGAYRLTTSERAADSAWDGFLSRANHTHVQSGLWGQLKAASGWKVHRVLVEGAEGVVGGAQLLFRPLPLIGSVGYVAKGPVLDAEAPGLYRALLGEVLRAAAAEHVRYLIVQPESEEHGAVEDVLALGFAPSLQPVAPTASVVIDLRRSEEELFAGMNTTTRRNVRAGQRHGITVREGTRADLPVFYRLLSQTAQRQGFTPEPAAYYDCMWEIFHPGGNLQLFISELSGQALGALIALAFADIVVYKRAGWSGELGKARPNQVMLWTSICWAKAQGFRFYDLEGIAREIAEAALAEQAIPIENSDTYKLNFGGNVVLFPTPYARVIGADFGGLPQRVLSALQSQPLLERFVKSLRAS